MRKSNATLLGEIYDLALVHARGAAHECGYALAVHGSELRDLDVIAVPWTEEAKSGDEVIAAIIDAVGGRVTGASDKPHGRRAVSIAIGDVLGNFKPLQPYIDVSVVPFMPSVKADGDGR